MPRKTTYIKAYFNSTAISFRLKGKISKTAGKLTIPRVRMGSKKGTASRDTCEAGIFFRADIMLIVH